MEAHTRVSEEDVDLFIKPSRLIICGFSNSGKTYLTSLIVKKYADRFEKIVCIGGDLSNDKVERDDEFQPFGHNLDGGLLLIVDDSILNKNRMQLCSSVFTRGRHEKISIILISQSLYPNCPHFRMCALNASHYIIFRTRDMSQISRFSTTFVQSDKKNEFLSLYRKEVLGRKYGYIMLDFTQDFNSPLCLRSDITGDCERAFLL